MEELSSSTFGLEATHLDDIRTTARVRPQEHPFLVVVVGVGVVPDDDGALEDVIDVLEALPADHLGYHLVARPHDLQQTGSQKVSAFHFELPSH